MGQKVYQTFSLREYHADRLREIFETSDPHTIYTGHLDPRPSGGVPVGEKIVLMPAEIYLDEASEAPEARMRHVRRDLRPVFRPVSRLRM